MKKISLLSALLFFISAHNLQSQVAESKLISNPAFTIRTEKYGIGELMKTGDVHPTT
jgi:hypothetical protein